MKIDDLIGIGEVAALLGLSPDTVRYYDPKLLPGRVSGRRLYSRDVVLAFAAERAQRRALLSSTRTDR